MALSRLYDRQDLPFLTDQDRLIGNAIVREQTSLSTVFTLDLEKALPEMIGHPLLFVEDSSMVPVEFVKGEPELLVEITDEWIHLSFLNEIAKSGVTLLRESRFRFKVFQITEDYRRIAKIITPHGLQVPLTERENVVQAIGNISSYMTVHSAIGCKSSGIAEVDAEAGTYAQLLPLGSGFRLEMFVKPFKTGGPYLKPGRGVETVMTEVNGRRVQTRRDLELEEENAQQVEAACPALSLHGHANRIWYFNEIDDCLQVLLELQGLKELVTVEWPEGEKLTVSHQASFDQFYLKIQKKRDWFELSGHLQLDESLVLDMKKVLQVVEKSQTRFIPLGEGQFLALTRELHNRLIEMNTLARRAQGKHDDGNIRIHPLATLALAEITSELNNIDAGHSWQRQMQRLVEAKNLQPQLPAGLKATLRDYQCEGYDWLSRLAHWGLGACLADDMGLGKTLQALAIILARAPNGPTLVVAPTSVSMNWQAETQRFAPTLNLIFLDGKDRKSVVRGMRGNDVLITSYTLLQQEEKLLASMEWETIVLDEAQAIKNTMTKRSKAAMSLKGRFRLITTGTPIENHLGELWNLFRFITPGLLGSLKEFNECFAVPIEKQQCPVARQKLKKILQPFILRRTKAQVLHELPPRTDVLLHVKMNDAEVAFYEALRRQALENLTSFNMAVGKTKTTAAGGSMQILAEITKLRRACCNPQLVAPGVSIVSSKLELFGNIVKDLRENNHKVLVFSQFVGHLALIRAFLDENGFSYRYLDGSTPLRERQKEVEGFQAGQGDLFLISLKAGGLGLNLTAADYVIHMDPWWNPAVEDQASDRAHRIGQAHPVTIYRLVTKDTIEEKIINLHHQKRILASNLLEDSDMSARISADELLNLIREQ
jgi:SNF2 family DNA or RNA helicase